MIFSRLSQHPLSRVLYQCALCKVLVCGKLMLIFNQVRQKRDNYRIVQGSAFMLHESCQLLMCSAEDAP